MFYLFIAEPLFFNNSSKHKKEIENIKIHHQQNIHLNNSALENKSNHNKNKPIKNTDIYRSVDQMPRFKSCLYYNETNAQICTYKQIKQYIEKIEVPDSLNIESYMNKLSVSFIIDENAYIKEVKVIHQINNHLKKEKNNSLINLVLVHMKNMPKFASPGLQNGVAVKVKYAIPFTFKP